MAKLSKQELIEKIQTNDAIGDEIKIELLEDVSDSFEESGENAEAEEWKQKYTEMKEKYISRFSVQSEDEQEDDSEDEPEDESEDETEEYVDLYEDED